MMQNVVGLTSFAAWVVAVETGGIFLSDWQKVRMEPKHTANFNTENQCAAVHSLTKRHCTVATRLFAIAY